MARPRTVSDEQILEAVRQSVLEHGPRVSLNEVASRVGVSQPALLKRFGSRQQLILSALVPRIPAPWLSHLEAGPDGSPLREQLEGLVGRLARDMEGRLPCWSALRESGIPHEEVFAAMKPPPPVVALKAMTGWLARAEKRGLVALRGLAVESVAAALMGAVIARAHAQHLLNRPWTQASTAEFVRDLTEMFLRVLLPSQSGGTR